MKVRVNNIKTYSYHGCLDEEGVIGSDYRVDVEVDVKNKLAQQTDNLSQTVDYSDVTKIVVEEMGIRSKLIETVSARIIKSCLLYTSPSPRDVRSSRMPSSA